MMSSQSHSSRLALLRIAEPYLWIPVSLAVLFVVGGPIAYGVLWPRHSLVISVVLGLIALVQLVRRRFRSAGVGALLALLLVAWFGWVNWFPHKLPTGEPVAVDIRAFGPEDTLVTTTITDPATIARLTRPFKSVRIISGAVKVLCDYWITFRSADGSTYAYRIRVDGQMMNDVSASDIQDVFVPAEPIPFDVFPASYRNGHDVNPSSTRPAD